MKFDIVTIFPQICEAYCAESILRRAQERGLIGVCSHNPRDFAQDKHRKTDDTPYGGGAGMVMKPEPIFCAVEFVLESKPNISREKTRIILLSAKGKRFTQNDAKRLTGYDRLILVCGRYEGVDERVAEHLADEEISLGDFVLTGGELPALCLTDAVARLLPGVLGNEESAVDESHMQEGVLEYPQYTKPEEFRGWRVPEVLLSGNHAEIARFRREVAQRRK